MNTEKSSFLTIIASLLLIYMFIIFPASDRPTIHHGVFLVCENGLDDNDNCDGTSNIGSDFIALINPATGIVQINITNNREGYFKKYIYLDQCKFADASNWVCGKDSGSLNDLSIDFGMDGRALYKIDNLPSVDSDSSIMDIPYYLYKYKILSIKQAVGLSAYL